MNDELGPQCSACGARSAAGQRFCTSCGTPLPEPETVPPLFADEAAPVAGATCRTCGANLAPGLKFCTECGSPVAAEAASPAPAPPPPPPPPRSGCPSCGAATTPGLRFCTSCGTPLAGATGATGAVPAPLPVPSYLPSPRRRGRWVAGALVVVLLLAAGGAAAWFLTRDDDSNRAVDRDPTESRSSTATDGEQSTGSDEDADDETSASAEQEPQPSPSSEPPPVASDPVTCWDGTGAQTVGECSLPEGRAGLEYVFPSMAVQDCSGVGASPAIGRTILVQCLAYLDDGTEIKINYSQWESVAAAKAHYDSKLTSTGQADGAYTWTGRAKNQYNAAGLYVAEPFSTSVYAPTQSDLALALGLLQGRAPDQVRGGPTT